MTEITDIIQKLHDLDKEQDAILEKEQYYLNQLYQQGEVVAIETLAGTSWKLEWTVDYENVFLEIPTSAISKDFLKSFSGLRSFYLFGCRVTIDDGDVMISGKIDSAREFLLKTHGRIGKSDHNREISNLHDRIKKLTRIVSAFDLEI